MAKVEVFGEDEGAPLFIGEFDFLPRVGDTISKDMGGYFGYYTVIEVWHRERADSGVFRPCIQVELRD